MTVVIVVTTRISAEKPIDAIRWTPTTLPQLVHRVSPKSIPLTGKVGAEHCGHLRIIFRTSDLRAMNGFDPSGIRDIGFQHW